ncbi:MAG: MarC family protein, partial [Alphaproteobacteria bacterium]
MLEIFLASLVTFFVVIDPPGCIPLFTSLTKDMPLAWRHRMAWKSVMIATCILFGFAVAGEWVLDKLHVSLDAFRIAGGLLLFIIALDMLFETRKQRREARNEKLLEEQRAHPGSHEDISVFPLAIPLIAGPG